MDPRFTVLIFVGRPPSEVFEAVADPDKLSAYFTTGRAKGRLEEGATVTWDFHDFPGAFPVEVDEVVPNERIAIRWDASEVGQPAGYQTVVTFRFSPIDDGARTKVEVEEHGWHESEAGLEASYGNCMGWSQMLCALKAWVEHGINLREGAYK
jgi:uncharacterized protein YndB with AHSA1/START domain